MLDLIAKEAWEGFEFRDSMMAHGPWTFFFVHRTSFQKAMNAHP